MNDEINKSKWIDAIKKHHEITDHNFYVCIRHFNQSDYRKKGNRFVLNSNVIPSIFTVTNQQLCMADHANELPTSYDFVDDEESQASGSNSEALNKTKAEINYDVKLQGLMQKIGRITEQNMDKTSELAEIKKKFREAQSKIDKLQAELDKMKSNRYVTGNVEETKRIEMEQIVDCLCNGIVKGRDSYPEHLRSFACTLHYHSPRAYDYVREKFNKNLPHKSTIQGWYANSNIDANPGICSTAIELLKEKAAKMRENGKQLVVSLIFDEMSIRKHVQWCSASRKFLGYATYGRVCDDDEIPIANQAIVFMISGLNDFFQVPVAHYFIKSLDANERRELLTEVIEELSVCDMKIASITFDGYAANATMSVDLGATLKDDIDPTIKHPLDGSDIQIILDPSHAEKLVRSSLESRRVFFDEDRKKIEWRYFVELVKYSQDTKTSFGMVHKLTKRHIDFHNRKMCVRTAVELFSSSVANAMEYLMNSGVPQFANAEATIKFCRIFDRLFDIMNTSRIKRGNKFKSAINKENKDEIFEFLRMAKHYILSLKVAGKKRNKFIFLVKSGLKTGFRGFVMDIMSIMKIYEEYVEKQKCMPYLATYRLSQDHLEMFFGRIRSKNGYNDNPTVQQFRSAFQKLFFCVDVLISSWSNVTDKICSSNILKVSSRRVKLYDDLAGNVVVPEIDADGPDEDVDSFAYEQLDQLRRTDHLVDMHFTGIAFVANLIENRILSTDLCNDCRLALEGNERVAENVCLTAANRKPCKSTYDLCKLTDSAIKEYLHRSAQSTFKQKVYIHVLSNIDTRRLYPYFLEEYDHDYEHKNYLIKFIIDEYTRIKCVQIAKLKTMEMQKAFLRNSFRKNLHYMGQ